MTASVFPPANLPGRAAAWGRAVESRIARVGGSISQNTGLVGNGERSFSGQLSVSSTQIEELENRSTEIAAIPDISVSGSASVDPFPSQSALITFSQKPGDRPSILSLSGVASNSATSFDNTGDRLAVVVLSGGNIVMRQIVQINLPASTPPAWFNDATVAVRTSLIIPGGVAPEFTLSVYRVGGYTFQQVPPFAEIPSPPSTVTLSNIQVVLDRSGVV